MKKPVVDRRLAGRERQTMVITATAAMDEPVTHGAVEVAVERLGGGWVGWLRACASKARPATRRMELARTVDAEAASVGAGASAGCTVGGFESRIGSAR